jgi:hypothetical protein
MWFLSQNKLVADKRRDEEMKQTLKEWSGARARIEGEIKRKLEHVNSATKFAESRAFHRSNFKTKNFNPDNNPLNESTSSSEDGDDEAQVISNAF